MEFPPVQLEIQGVAHQFEYEHTECHIYRLAVDQPFNHIRAVEFGSQVVHLFHVEPYIMYLTGQELFPHEYSKKQLRQILSDMDEKTGWNSDLIIKDKAPEEIKERYVCLATTALRSSNVFPEAWTKSTT